MNLGGWGSGEDLGVLGEGEIVIRIHCIKKTILKMSCLFFASIYKFRRVSFISYESTSFHGVEDFLASLGQ